MGARAGGGRAMGEGRGRLAGRRARAGGARVSGSLDGGGKRLLRPRVRGIIDGRGRGQCEGIRRRGFLDGVDGGEVEGFHSGRGRETRERDERQTTVGRRCSTGVVRGVGKGVARVLHGVLLASSTPASAPLFSTLFPSPKPRIVPQFGRLLLRSKAVGGTQRAPSTPSDIHSGWARSTPPSSAAAADVDVGGQLRDDTEEMRSALTTVHPLLLSLRT